MKRRRDLPRQADRSPGGRGTARDGASPSEPSAWNRHRGDLLAVLFAVPLAIPFLTTDWFFGHDNMHLIRLFEQDVMIHAGQFPVRWYPDVAAGYGSPHPQFYAPLFYLLAQLFLFAGLPLAASLKATIVGVTLGTSLAMYRWVRALFGETSGLIAAIALSYAPYHMLDLYVRTAFSELTVFLFLPLTLLAFHRLASRVGAPTIAAAGAAVGALCLAHTITVMLVPPLLAGCVLLSLWRRDVDRRFLPGAAAASVLGFGIAAFFLVPLVAERGAVDAEIYASAYFDYRKHFAALAQLLHSPWGFGLSREGTGDGISFRLGLLQIAGGAIALWRWPGLRAERRRAAGIIFAALISAAGIFMALPISSPLWALVPPLRCVQFPWRFLILPAIGLSFLCGAAAWGGRTGREGNGSLDSRAAGAPIWIAGILFVVTLVASAEMFGFRQRIPFERIGFGGDHTDMRDRGEKDAGASPTVFTRAFVRAETLHWFDHLPPGGYPYPPKEDLAKPKAEIERGGADIEMLEESPSRYRMRVRASLPSLLRLNVYRFPGWSWELDGRPASAGPPPGRRPILTLEVPAGEHVAVATYVRTPARFWGDALSAAALAATAALAAAALRSRRPTG